METAEWGGREAGEQAGMQGLGGARLSWNPGFQLGARVGGGAFPPAGSEFGMWGYDRELHFGYFHLKCP